MASSALALPVSDDGKKAWQGIRTRKNRFAVWKIENEIVELYEERFLTVFNDREKAGEANDSQSQFLAALPDTHCRYTVYDHEFKTKDGRVKSTLLFISWTPLNSNQSDKILYSQQRHAFKESLNGTVHHNVNTKKEIEKIIKACEGVKEDDEDSDDD